jgi:hypothetical protein
MTPMTGIGARTALRQAGHLRRELLTPAAAAEPGPARQ